MKKIDSDYAIGKPYGNCDVIKKGTEYEHRKGKYVFKEGVVTFYDEPRITTFEFVFKGRYFGRTIIDKKKQFTDKSLIIQAGKFGREVVESYL